MKAELVAAHAKRVAEHMIHSRSAARAMIEIVKAYAVDDEITGTAMIEIFGAALVFMSEAMDKTAQQALGGVVQMMTLLYPGKTPEQLLTLAAGFLAGEDMEEAAPRVRVVVMSMRKDE